MNREKVSVTGLDEIELLRILYAHNPWWMSGEVPPSKAPPFKRRDFYKLSENLDSPKILALVGARRVGKTTLMYQLIEHLLSKGLEPEKILYISLDDPYLKIATIEVLMETLNLYSKYVLKRPLSDLKEQIYIFLDEIQTLKNWENALKRWYDLSYKMKFLVSGSSSVNIMISGAESLVGRLSLQIVLPMKFLEVVRFQMAEEDFERRFNKINWQLRQAFKDAVKNGDVHLFYSALKDSINRLAKDVEYLTLFLHKYLLKGGYPEIVATDDMYKAAENLKTYLNLTIYKDIVRTFKIRDPIAFEDLISVLARECSQRINYSKLARDLGLKRQTLKSYIYFLKTAFLISESEFYSKSRVKRARREKKVYVNDPGIRNAAAGMLDEHLLNNPAEIGKVVEAVVADHCKRLKFNLEPSLETQLFYWKDRGYEVDIVMELFQRVIPIEVKYKDSVDKRDLKGLQEFSRNHKPPFQMVIMREKLDYADDILFIPCWLFLLMC